MAVRLRLRRTGKKKQVHYRLVAADARFPRDGRFLETVGHFNPRMNQPTAVVNEERVFYWLDKGAEMSEAFRGVLKNKGLLLKYELIKKDTPEAKIDEEMQKWAMSYELRQKKKSEKLTKTKKKKAKMEAEAAESVDEKTAVAEETAEEVKAEETATEDAPAETEEKAETEKSAAEEPAEEVKAEETAAEAAPAEAAKPSTEKPAAEEKAEEP